MADLNFHFFEENTGLIVLNDAFIAYPVLSFELSDETVFKSSFEMAASDGALAIEVEPRISEYLSLVMRLIFAFGLAFELPVILLLLARAGLVTPEGLAEKRKIAIVVAFVAAAILTPPDVISQVLLATPIILLYELSIFGAKIMNKRPKDEFDD